MSRQHCRNNQSNMKYSPTYITLTIVALTTGSLLLRQYMAGGWFYGNEQIPGKTVLITGANTGIGKETAQELARRARGGRIIMACRDMEKAQKARDEIISASGNTNVFVKHLDLSSFASIREFAKDILETEQHIHILINNAGVMWTPKMLTKDGFEMQFGTNHLGHFLLTNLLLEKIKDSAPSRIINVASRAHARGTINFDDLNSEKNYNAFYAYEQSKLANVLFTRELAHRLNGTGVTVYALHPGVVYTELLRYSPIVNSRPGQILRFLLTPLQWLLLKTPIEGAQTTLYCALASELEGVSGKYYSDCAEKDPSLEAQNDTYAKRLWSISEEWTQLK